ncbi:hypothetical protein MPL1032_110156 [Mesorhizobium plurifarium]|uniref:Uncharacterized protein n=1 Tax=Mesorhizobium plurifarium TaxID=69974 RepID=A0A0K2VQ80_MESPL|nr:hypothetical protein MPL1032_110156 [Mesorhizobium plurifarium]
MRYFLRNSASCGGVKIRSSVRGSGALITSGKVLSDMFSSRDTIGSRQSHLSSLTPGETIYKDEKSIYRLD